MSIPVNKTPFLQVQRIFPKEAQPLSVELQRAYIDIAAKVNARSIGIFATAPSVTGDVWYLSGGVNKQQTLRQVYEITGAGNYAHGITTSKISGFTKIYGTFYDGSANWYPLPYVDVTNATNQVSLYVTSSNIVVTVGGGSPPTVSRGYVVLEWLSNV